MPIVWQWRHSSGVSMSMCLRWGTTSRVFSTSSEGVNKVVTSSSAVGAREGLVALELLATLLFSVVKCQPSGRFPRSWKSSMIITTFIVYTRYCLPRIFLLRLQRASFLVVKAFVHLNYLGAASNTLARSNIAVSKTCLRS